MKATDVRILPALDPGESYIEPSFLMVETTLDEQGKIVTSIDHVFADVGKDWEVKALGHSVPLTHPAAREWAVAYAASHEVPLVYERDETNRVFDRIFGPDTEF